MTSCGPIRCCSCCPNAGLGGDQAVAIRELALGALIRFRDGGGRRPRCRRDDVVLRIMEFAVGGTDMAAYLPLLEEELGHRGEDRRAPTWHKVDVRRGRTVPGRRHRRRHVRPARRPPPAAGRGRPRRLREGRRRRRHLVREPLPGLPGRQPEPHLQLLVRAAPRLAVPLLDPAGAPAVPPRLRRRVRAAGADPVRHRGRVRGLVGRRPPLDGHGPVGRTAARRRRCSTRW